MNLIRNYIDFLSFLVPSSVEVNRDPGDVDFSLNNLLNKVKKHSPGPILSQSNVLPPEVNAEVIPELLSQERSPFSINSIPILGKIFLHV